MIVTGVVPARGPVALDALLDELAAAPSGRPYGDDALAFCAELATRLINDPVARVHPELMTLGFFLRRAELVRMRREFEASARPDVVRVPQGLVFHVPPANVDTIFVYSWVLSLLAGNANLVRLSSRTSPVVDHLCALLDELLARPVHATIRARAAMIRYGHDDALTAAISARCALRLIWGGDASIAAVRRAPLAPGGRDLTFADRWSLLACGATAIAALPGPALAELAEGVFNDLFWFDQAACSSPRVCVWIGSPGEAAAAGARLWPAVAAVVARRGYHPDVASRLARELFVHREVLDGPVVGRVDHGPALAVVRIDDLAALRREHPGAGLLYEAVVPDLAALAGWVVRKDQTLTHAGLSREALVGLVEQLGGRGLDRVVPVGQALQMARFWDGYDLAHELVRHVHVLA